MREPSVVACVGRVVGLWRYPVKSMAAEALDAVDVSWHGLAGDRRWAFVREGMSQSGFPWLTLREHGTLNRYRPAFVDPSQPERSRTLVRTPTDASFDIADPALAHELWPAGARVIRQGRGIFDTFPVSLISTRSIDRLGDMLGTQLDVRRFRPNLLVDAQTPDPFPEDQWVGQMLRIGRLLLRIDKRDGRCAVITVNPDSGTRMPEILRTVAREREGCLGVYGSTVEPGRVAIGDAVEILR